MANKAKVVLLCVMAACAYGVLHDQITVRLCMEYFTVAHPPLFRTNSPTLLAVCWGVAATIGIGVLFGVLLALISQSDGRSPEPLPALARSVVVLLGLMAISSLLAGCLGYVLSQQGHVVFPDELAVAIPDSRHHRFMAVWFAHGASYVVGLAGASLVCFRLWNARGKPHVISALPRTKIAVFRAICVMIVAAIAIWLRFGRR